MRRFSVASEAQVVYDRHKVSPSVGATGRRCAAFALERQTTAASFATAFSAVAVELRTERRVSMKCLSAATRRHMRATTCATGRGAARLRAEALFFAAKPARACRPSR